jgi:2-keto-4-pentenoate hydratase/2-oxohepta-3-ene-1,7-dioic acid hydratase in catechol pathway
MRIVRFLCSETKSPAWGLQLPDSHPKAGEVHFAVGNPFDGGLTDTEEVVKAPKLLAPVQPAAILCIGLNYAAHAAEGGKAAPDRPVLFMKTPSAVQHHGEPIVLPRRLLSTRVDYEAELAIVIGKPCKNVSRADALKYVLGYTCGNDVSARDWQRNGGGGQWCRGKTFDTFAPLGPALVTTDELGDAGDLRITTTIGGEVLQDSRTSDMIFSVAKLVEFLSASVTLAPGTVILSGTPQGVGFARTPPRWLKAGDEVTIEIEGIGKLTNPVVEEQAEELTEWTLKDE